MRLLRQGRHSLGLQSHRAHGQRSYYKEISRLSICFDVIPRFSCFPEMATQI